MSEYKFKDRLRSDSARAVRKVYECMVWEMNAEYTGFQIQSLFCDDSDHHASRSASVKYTDVHIARVGKVFWMLAFGHVAGNAYLFDDMEVDIACRVLESLPSCEADLMKQLSSDFRKRRPGMNNFSSSFLGSREGRLVQSIRGDDSWKFDLIPWARQKFNNGRAFKVTPMRPFREAGNPFSEFLPTDCKVKLDQVFAKDLSQQIIFFLNSFGTGACACPSFDI